MANSWTQGQNILLMRTLNIQSVLNRLNQEHMSTSIESTIIASTPVLHRLAGKFTSDQSEKEDLVQETFIKSLKSLEKFEHHPKLISWLFVIMKNIYLNRYRRLNVARTAEKEILHQASMRGKVTNHAESKFVQDDIKASLCSLSEQNYGIFSMYVEGYKYHEIATHYNMKEGTVKTRIHTIRKILKKKLGVYRK